MADSYYSDKETTVMRKPTTQECLDQIDAVWDEVKVLQALTDGSMHGEKVFPDPRHYDTIYAILAWLKDHCG